MKEVTGNLWTYPATARVITTNGTVKKNGECVMGRGCAAEAKKRWPAIAKFLGDEIIANGNTVHALGIFGGDILYSFPVKHRWYERADINLILRSAEQLVAFEDEVKEAGKERIIVLPRPGCGNGGLKWEDVKPVLDPILDDRFHVITFR